MYWSVTQYQRPIMGAQNNMPTQGKFVLKYHAIRASSLTGAHVPSIPSGMSGFQRLNMSEPSAARSSPQPPRRSRPYTVRTSEPKTSTNVWTASV
jgi:hypothetical protein